MSLKDFLVIAGLSVVATTPSCVFSADAPWAISEGKPTSYGDFPSICFYSVNKKNPQAYSWVAIDGANSVRLDLKSGLGEGCELGNLNYVDFNNRIIFINEDELRLKRGDLEKIKNTLEQKLLATNAISLLEKARDEDQISTQRAERELYLSKFENADNLAKIYDFEKSYKDKDPDNLIQKLTSLKSSLEYKQYKSDFAASQTSQQLSYFITHYEGNDPDNLISGAKQRLLLAKKLDEEIRKRKDKEDQAAQKQIELEKLEKNLVWCNSQTTVARKTIDREHEIGLVSGYENKLALRRAGEIIIACREKTILDYEEYRKKGGKKSLIDLR